ncbi:hypothetical protein [Streptomyces sp. 6-11-2]
MDQWAAQLHAWMGRFRVPERVLLAEDDQQLPPTCVRARTWTNCAPT